MQRNRKQVGIVLLFLAPILPLMQDSLPVPRIYFYDSFSHLISSPMSQVFTYIRNGAEDLKKEYLSLVDSRKDNQILMERISELEDKSNFYKELEEENKRLRTVLKFNEAIKHPTVVAKIIGYDPQHETLSFLVNAGKNKNLKVGMPVVSKGAVVGTIRKVYSRSARVLSLLDPRHNLDGRIQRSRAQTIVEGGGERLTAHLKYIDRFEDIRVGDEVITTGLDDIFPKGFKIGTIVKVNRPSTGVTQEAEIRSQVDPGKLEEVIILNTEKESLKKGAFSS